MTSISALRLRASFRSVALWLGLAALSACATWSESFAKVERPLSRGDYPEALKIFEAESHPQRDLVLTQLNRAMLLRLNGELEKSNQSFEAAKKEMDRLTALSISETGATFIVNDAAASYAGDEHEQVLANLYAAFNYLDLGQLDDARVEALQVDERLKVQSKRSDGAARYTEDAFARYFTGMIYEDLGETSDALIAYRKSLEAYRNYAKNYNTPIPDALKQDLLRLSDYQGLSDERDGYKKTFDLQRWTSQDEFKRKGEIVFFLHNGLAPIKREERINVFAMGRLISISLPYYNGRRPQARNVRIKATRRAGDGDKGGDVILGQSELVEDIQSIAFAVLDDKLGAIQARAAARAVTRAVAGSVAGRAVGGSNRDSGGALLGALVTLGADVAGAMVERADTRSWATLPHDVQVARLLVPPGSYDLSVELLDGNGGVEKTLEIPAIKVRAARKTFISRATPASSFDGLRSKRVRSRS